MVHERDPAGFRSLRYFRYAPPDKRIHNVDLLLPTSLQKKNEDISFAAATIQEEEARLTKEVEEPAKISIETQDSSSVSNRNSSFSSSFSRKRPNDEVDLDTARVKLEQKSIKCGDETPAVHAVVYEWDQPMRLIAATRTPGKDLVSRNTKIFEAISTLGNTRSLFNISRERLEEIYCVLNRAHPNFKPVIAQLRKELLLSIARNKAPRLSPLLLAGQPRCW